MTNFDNEVYQYIAGIIDAEGTISMTLTSRNTRFHYLKIVTCDNIIVPYLCKLFKKEIRIKKPSGQAKSNGFRIRLVGSELRDFLPNVIPYLFIKKQQAECTLRALNIKCGKNEPYTNNESELWYNLYCKVSAINKRGNKHDVSKFYKNVYSNFTWPWLAGVIDGDGCIMLEKRNNTLKPSIKISLSNKKAIEYIAKNIGCNMIKSGRKAGNRRSMFAVRMLSNKMMEIGPKIINHLILKKKKLEIAMKIVNIRESKKDSHYNELKNNQDEINNYFKEFRSI